MKSQSQFRFSEEGHRYWIDGTEVISVTGLLAHFRLTGMENVPTYFLEQANHKYKLVHKTFQLHLSKTLNEETLDPMLNEYLNGLKKFERDNKMVTYATEEIVGSPECGVAGTLDWRGELNGVHTILDWTGAAKPNPAKIIQGGGYKYLCNLGLNYGVKKQLSVKQFLAFQFVPNNYKPFPKKFYLDGNADERIFMSLVNIYNWQKKMGVK